MENKSCINTIADWGIYSPKNNDYKWIETKEQVITKIKKMLDNITYSDYGYFLIVSNDIADILELSNKHWKTTHLNSTVEFLELSNEHLKTTHLPVIVEMLREVPTDLTYNFLTLKDQTMFLIQKNSKNENIKDRFIYSFMKQKMVSFFNVDSRQWVKNQYN